VVPFGSSLFISLTCWPLFPLSKPSITVVATPLTVLTHSALLNLTPLLILSLSRWIIITSTSLSMTPMEMTLVVLTISLLLLQPHQTLGTFSSHLTTQLHVVSFQGDKLLSGAMFYHFSNRTAITTMDTFSLEFRYGHATSGLIPFTVCIHHIPLPILNHARSISLARGGWSDHYHTPAGKWHQGRVE